MPPAHSLGATSAACAEVRDITVFEVLQMESMVTYNIQPSLVLAMERSEVLKELVGTASVTVQLMYHIRSGTVARPFRVSEQGRCNDPILCW
jgi:hypothetical protein